MCAGRASEAPSEKSASQIGDKQDAESKRRVEVEQGCSEHQDGDGVGKQMLPVAMKEGHGEDANKSFSGVWHKSPFAQVDAEADFGEFCQPHERYDEQRDDEAANEFPSFLFFVHAVDSFKFRTAAKIGKNGRRPNKKTVPLERFF